VSLKRNIWPINIEERIFFQVISNQRKHCLSARFVQWNFGISTTLAVAEHSSEDLKRFHSQEQRFLPRLDPCDPFFELFRVNPASRHYSIREISAAVAIVTNSLASTSENRVEVKGTLIQLVRLTIIFFPPRKISWSLKEHSKGPLIHTMILWRIAIAISYFFSLLTYQCEHG